MGGKKLFLNPFPGIRSFEAEEDVIFFGRESQIKELVPRLYETHFLAITGSSGCGKSSLVRAGLLPSLFKGKHIANELEWHHQIFRPGNEPILRLSESLFSLFKELQIQILSESGDVSRIYSKLIEDTNGLSNLLQQIVSQKKINLLFVIDQFEELFRYQQATEKESVKSEADKFVQLILQASRKIPNAFFIITMRSDFLGDCTEFRGLPEAINKGHHLVVRMSDEEKRLAITKPIEVCGGSISNRLIAKLLHDVGDDPDQLPVMQHALMRTWDYWILNRIGDEPIDLNHYEAIGTMQQAISHHAEKIYQELSSQQQKFLTEKLFKALTDLGSDNTGRGTRRPTPLKDICTLAEAKESELISIIDIFRAPGCAFLMPSHHYQLNEDSIIDISHESIMRKWERLKEWVEEETKSAQLYLRLSKSSELYLEGKTALWVNPELQLAINWQNTNKPNRTWAARYDFAFDRAMQFLDFSKKEFEQEIAKREKQQQRELKRTRRFALFLGAASIISLMFLLVSLNLRFKAEASEKKALEKEKIASAEQRVAEQQKREAVSQKRIAEQQQQIAEQQQIITEEQKQYAVEQQKIAEDQKKEALQQKQQADFAKSIAIQAKDEAEKQKQDAINQKKIADSERLKAEVSEKNTMRLRLLAIARSMAIQSVKIQNNPQLTNLLAFNAYLYNDRNNGPENEPDIFTALSNAVQDNLILRNHSDGVRSLAVLNNALISCSDDGSVIMWNINYLSASPTPIPLPEAAKKGVRTITLSRDENWIAFGTTTGNIYLKKTKSLEGNATTLSGNGFVITGISFNYDNSLLAAVGSDRKLRLWKISSSTITSSVIDSSVGKFLSVAFHPKQNLILAGDEKGRLTLHNLENNSKKILIENGKAITSITFNYDGTSFLVGNSIGGIQFWETNNLNNKPVELLGHTSSINSIRFFNDTETFATASSDRIIRVWNLNKLNELPLVIDSHDSWIYDVAFSKDGTKLFSASEDRTIQARTIKSSLVAKTLKSKLSRNFSFEEWNKFVGEDIPYEKSLGQ